MEKVKSRNYKLILYPNEDISHKQALEYIKENYSYAYINHDSDLDEFNNIKKEHYHVIISFSNARYKNVISEELGVLENYIRPSVNIKSDLLYLIHANNKDKYQYSIDDVYGDLKDKLKSYLDSNTLDEENQIKIILDYISAHAYGFQYNVFYQFILDNHLWSVFRRNSASIFKYINHVTRNELEDLFLYK